MTTALVAGKTHELIYSGPTDSLEAYMRAVSNIPVLSAEDEHALAVRLHTQNDLEAARQLVLSHLRFVAHIARGYRGYGLPLGDLIQEGNIGLMKAVKRFDPNVGVRLISFAVHWIKAEIHEFILRNWRIVKIATTKAQRKLFFNLRKSKPRLGWFSREEAETVANDLGVPVEQVVEMEARLAGQDVTYEHTPHVDEDDHAVAPAAYLADPQAEADPAVATEQDDWEADGESRLNHALTRLDERSRKIMQKRWLAESKVTLQELADEYGISAERVRQLENNAIKKLRGMMLSPE